MSYSLHPMWKYLISVWPVAGKKEGLQSTPEAPEKLLCERDITVQPFVWCVTLGKLKHLPGIPNLKMGIVKSTSQVIVKVNEVKV